MKLMLMQPQRRRVLVPLTVGLAVAGLVASPAAASHSWSGYHWARTANPLKLNLGDNVDSKWNDYLGITSSDWSASTVVATTVVAGRTTGRKCSATAGRVEVCNAAYGQRGWLGVAQIWLSGSHITQGTVKLNDTYFDTAAYNTPAWRNLVSCQEVGHTLGLEHQDENFTNANLGTCMDYSNDPSTNQHPNQHDYDQLASIYFHTDASNTATQSVASAAATAGPDNGEAEWGRAIRYSSDGRPSRFERDLGNGSRLVTFVTWAL